MEDLREKTLDGLLKDGVPPHDELPEEQQATAEAVRAIALGDVATDPRKQRPHKTCVEEHALCFRKWGMEYVKDTTAYLLFCAAKLKSGDDNLSGAAAAAVLPAVDWDIMEKLFRENWESYQEERRQRGTHKGIGAKISGLKWALGSRGIPGVRNPGDLFRRMTERGPAN